MPSDLGASVLLAWSKEISVENSNTVEISVNKIDWPDCVINPTLDVLFNAAVAECMELQSTKQTQP